MSLRQGVDTRTGGNLRRVQTNHRIDHPLGQGKRVPYEDFFRELVEQDQDIRISRSRDDAMLWAMGMVLRFITVQSHAVSSDGGADTVVSPPLTCHGQTPAQSETTVKTNGTRLRGWTAKGQRLKIDAPCATWQTQTLP